MKMNFKIEANEIIDESGNTGAQVVVDTNCDIKFLMTHLGHAIIQMNESLNDSTAAPIIIKNGFWLMLEEYINDYLKRQVEAHD